MEARIQRSRTRLESELPPEEVQEISQMKTNTVRHDLYVESKKIKTSEYLFPVTSEEKEKGGARQG